jgi:hypothetical protein
VERSEVDALAGRVAAVEKSEKSAASGHRAVRLVFVATALKAAAERGEPFAGELAAAQSLGADPKLTAALEPFAAAGVPRVAKPVARPLRGHVGQRPRQHYAERAMRTRQCCDGPRRSEPSSDGWSSSPAVSPDVRDLASSSGCGQAG